MVYSVQGTILAVSLDVSALELSGGSVRLIQNMMPVGPFPGTHFGFSESGALAYVPDSARMNTVPMWVSHDGREEPLQVTPMPYRWAQLSPDGTRVALDLSPIVENSDIWIYHLERETTTRFTFGAARNFLPVWTPDGERIVFHSDREGGGLFWKRADGTGSVEHLTTEDDNFQGPSTISPDGRLVVFVETHPANRFDIKTVTLDGERVVEPLLATPFDEIRPSISPDGRWMAYQSDESGQFDVYVRPFPDVDGGKWQVSRDGGNSPVWARDGKALFYGNGQAMMRVAVATEPTFSASMPELLFEGPYTFRGRSHDVAPLGERLLMVKRSTDTPREIHVVLNWFEELKARVPTGN